MPWKEIKIWINGLKLWVTFTDVFAKKKKEINIYKFLSQYVKKRK